MPRTRALPRSLTFGHVGPRAAEDHAVMRRRMTKVCPDDGRARLIYGVFDTGQPIGHAGLLLYGREIVGWIVTVYSTRIFPASAGDTLRHVRLDYLSPAPAFLAMAAAVDLAYCRLADQRHGQQGHYEREAIRSIQVHEETDPSARSDQREVDQWSGELCYDLTRIVGAVEVYRAEKYQQDFASEGVLVPREVEFSLGDRPWRLMQRKTAERLALQEALPGRGDLPMTETEMTIAAPAGTGLPELDDRISLTVTSLKRRATRIYRSADERAQDLLGRAEYFIVRGAMAGRPATIEAQRSHRDDLAWTLLMDGVGRVAYDDLVDGCAALQVAIDALVAGRLPPDYVGPAGGADLARQAFRQAVKDTHDDFRLYRHVLDSMTRD